MIPENALSDPEVEALLDAYEDEKELHGLGADSGQPLDSYDWYLAEIRKHPSCSHEKSVALASNWGKTGSQEARDALIQENLSLVIVVAKQYQSHGLSLQELISIGNAALVEAIAQNEWKPDLDDQFFTIGRLILKQVMQREILNFHDIPTDEAHFKLFFNLEKYMRRLDRSYETGLLDEDVLKICTLAQAHRIQNLARWLVRTANAQRYQNLPIDENLSWHETLLKHEMLTPESLHAVVAQAGNRKFSRVLWKIQQELGMEGKLEPAKLISAAYEREITTVVTPEHVRYIFAMKRFMLVSLNVCIPIPGEKAEERLYSIADESAPDPSEDAALQQRRELVQVAVSMLSNNNRRTVIEKRYLAGESPTQEEVGEMLNVNKSRIGQIEQRGFQDLRKIIHHLENKTWAEKKLLRHYASICNKPEPIEPEPIKTKKQKRSRPISI